MKIRTFPTPRPDELLYSVIARHHMRIGYCNPKDTLEDLFGSRTASATYDFPSRLQVLCDRLPGGFGLTPEKIIGKLTLLPYYQPFLLSERCSEIKAKMALSDSGGSIHALLGFMSRGKSKLNFLRFCPKCLEEDRQIYGEGFWHRSHQLLGTKVCHKHHVHLVDGQTQVGSRVNKHTFYALEQDLSAVRGSGHLEAGRSRVDIWLAEKAHWLLNAQIDPIGLESLRERYLGHLIKKGLARPMGQLRREEFRESFLNYYGDDFLDEMGCGVKKDAEHCWLFPFVNRCSNASSPIRHLLVMKFLEVEPEEFLTDLFEDVKPFGEGPYPCLNSACDYHRKPVIKDVTITRNTKTNYPVGNFVCDCGFAYARTGPDTCPDDKFKRTRIISMGPVWEKELLRLDEDPTVNLRQKARWLGVATNTIRIYLDRLKGRAVRSKTSANITSEAKRAEYRKVVLDAVKASPEMGRTKIRALLKRQYAWLYRHDRDWLFENMPQPVTRRRKSKSIVDWERRDEEWARKAEVAIDGFFAQKNHLKRLTLGRVGEMLGCLTSLNKNLHKLPKTNAVILKHLESVDDFQIRRVRVAVNELVDEGESLAEWKIVRKANLNPNYSSVVQSEIDLFVGHAG